jgi:biopolymer transport protein ExbB
MINLVKYYNDGGMIMHPILLCSVIGVMFVIERFVMLIVTKRKASPEDLMNEFDAATKEGGGKEKVAERMINFCREKGGPACNIMLEGLKKYQEAARNKLGFTDAKAWITQAIEEQGRVEIPTLEKHLNVISLTAQISPLLGLLGTVQGMILAFEVMAQSAGGARPDELAGGIAMALITTFAGLCVAIPLLVFYNWIRTSIDNMVVEIEEVANQVTDKLIEK